MEKQFRQCPLKKRCYQLLLLLYFWKTHWSTGNISLLFVRAVTIIAQLKVEPSVITFTSAGPSTAIKPSIGKVTTEASIFCCRITSSSQTNKWEISCTPVSYIFSRYKCRQYHLRWNENINLNLLVVAHLKSDITELFSNRSLTAFWWIAFWRLLRRKWVWEWPISKRPLFWRFEAQYKFIWRNS